MQHDKQIQMDLIKLAGGERLLRVSEPTTGLCLEKKLDPRQPVLRQKQRLVQAFEAVLAREAVLTA
jgi:hypothetical protein